MSRQDATFRDTTRAHREAGRAGTPSLDNAQAFG